MSLTYELNQDNVSMNHRVIYQGQRSLYRAVIERTHTESCSNLSNHQHHNHSSARWTVVIFVPVDSDVVYIRVRARISTALFRSHETPRSEDSGRCRGRLVLMTAAVGSTETERRTDRRADEQTDQCSVSCAAGSARQCSELMTVAARQRSLVVSFLRRLLGVRTVHVPPPLCQRDDSYIQRQAAAGERRTERTTSTTCVLRHTDRLDD